MTLRAPHDEDAAEIAEFASTFALEPVAPERILREWTSPGTDRERDVRVGPGEHAVVEVFDERGFLTLHGRPSAELMEWAEARAAESAKRLLSGAWTANEDAKRVFEERGFRPVRHVWRMQIDLAEEPEAPAWPEGVRAR